MIVLYDGTLHDFFPAADGNMGGHIELIDQAGH